MGELVGRVRSLALALGGPGLALVAFLDSTFLPLPGITDLLLVVMVTRRPGAMVGYVLLTVAGSVTGCLVMHAIGRKGGEALVRQRFTGEKTERAMAALQRNGVMAVLIPSLLPPPAPFKIFVLLAGVAGISTSRFTTAILIGRGVRYFGEGLLAIWYGDRAVAFLAEHAKQIGLWLAAIALIGGLGWATWQRRRQTR